MPLTDNRGWAIGRVEVRIPEIAEASSYCDFRSNISRMQQYSKSVIFDCPWAGGRGATACGLRDSHITPFWYALVAACVLSNSSGATPAVQKGDCPCSASSKAAGQAPMRV